MPFTIAAYTHDHWDHVCPRVRLLDPASTTGVTVLRAGGPQAQAIVTDPRVIEQADLVFILRDFPRAAEQYETVVREARRLGKKVVYELDDLLFDLPTSHPDVLFYSSVRYRLLRAIVEADAVIVTTDPLRDVVSAYHPYVFTVPNYLNQEIWQSALSQENHDSAGREPVVIGYQGGRGHIPDLESIAPALLRVLQRYGPKVKMKFWGAPPPEILAGWPNVEWLDPGIIDYAAFAAYFQQQVCDLFIAPVIDNPFNRCKSPLKFLEYSALGIPGIYSRSQPYSQVIQENHDGLLATSIEEWEDNLSRLIDRPELRREIGSNARRSILANWLLRDHAGKFLETLRQIQDLPMRPPLDPGTASILEQSKRWQAELDMLFHRQQEAFNLRLEEQQKQLEKAQADLNNILNGVGWNWLQRAHQIVERIAPSGSRRAELVGKGVAVLRSLRRKPTPAPRLESPDDQFKRIFDQDDRHPVIYRQAPPSESERSTPCIAILMPVTAPESHFEGQLTAWLEKQTWRNTELIRWDGELPSASKILTETNSKYICVASNDLLRQHPTYLETNLLALEGENLAFTLNTFVGKLPKGETSWLRNRIKAGSLPGDTDSPLLRVVVRKDCLNDLLEIDVSPVLRSRLGDLTIVGRILSHDSEFPDHKLSFAYNQHLRGGGLFLLGPYIVAYPFAESIPNGMIQQPVQSLEHLSVAPLSDPRPTVLMIMPFLAVGGAERIAINMMQELVSQIRFITVTLEPHDPSLGTTAEEFRRLSPLVYTFPELLPLPLFEAGLKYLIQQYHPETLYIANGAIWIYTVLPSLRAQYPKMRIANQVYDHIAGWINWYTPEVVRSIDSHIGSNQDIDRAYIQKGARPEQVFHIENGVDTDWYDPGKYSPEETARLRAALNVPPDRKIVTFIARLHPQKRPLDFIEIARRCEGSEPYHFLMVGDGLLGDQVDQEIQKSGITNLTRLPFYTPSRDIYAISDVVMLPSEYEGMPMVLLEAQSMGKPFVATQVGNIRQVLEKTGGGIAQSSPGDINGLISSINEVLHHPPDPVKIRSIIREEYSLKKMGHEYLAALLPPKDA